ncbi:hypothetical protein TRVL_06261 [Trypanosoma vivax]|nr:hypothetical protein TRVL_06261 [Trypanosoma vivax]
MLTRTLCRLMERIVARRVRNCNEDKLQPQQAGFGRARSTLDTLTQATGAVRRRRDGERTAPAFTGYARAFDSVDRGCIVKAPLSFGVGKRLVAWIARFLKGRAAKVRAGSALSEDTRLTCGVPRGSLLGSLLFIVAGSSRTASQLCAQALVLM